MYDLGFIRGFTVVNSFYIRIYLKFYFSSRVLRDCFLISLPSNRCYFGCNSLNGSRVNNYISINSFVLVSTSRGVLSDIECIMFRVGGEPLVFLC